MSTILNGQKILDGVFQGGLVGNPSIRFANSLVDGFYYIGTNNIGLALNGIKTFDFSTTALGLSMANPMYVFKDTNCTDSDINASIDAQATDTGSGTEDIDVTFKQQVAGVITTFFVSDADGSMTIGLPSQAVAFNTSALSGITTLSMNNQLTNTLADGTTPFVITSTTKVANLNVDRVDDLHASAAISASGALSITANVYGLHATGGTAVTIAHSTADGYVHLPSGGTANQILKNSGAAGTGAWGTVTENAGALAAVTTIGMSGDLTMSANTANITHSGTTSLTIVSTSGTVAVESVVFTGGAISSVTTLGMAGDLTDYEATNDGNPEFLLGSSATERLHIQSVYDTGAQTLSHLLFQTDTASATADKGQFKFNVDGSEIARIDDDGLEIDDTALGTTTSAAIKLTNLTAAALDTQQVSPSLKLTGYGWETTGGSSDAVDWQMYVLPVQGTAAKSTLVFQSQENGGGWVDQVTFSNATAGASSTQVNAYRFSASNMLDLLSNWQIYPGNELGVTGGVVQDVYGAKTHVITGNIADGASAIGLAIGNKTALTTAGAKIVSFVNDTTEKAYIDLNGGFTGNGYNAFNMGAAATNGVVLSVGANNTTMPAATTAWRDLQTLGNVTELANATITDITGAYFNTFTITDGGGTETVGFVTTVYIAGAPTAGTTPTKGPYALFVDAGTVRIDGSLGDTTDRVLSGFFTDLTVTNSIAGSVTGTAATVTGATQASITTCANLTTVGTIGTGVWQGTTIKANYLQQAAADLGDVDITVDLSNSNAGNVTNLTIDGTLTGATLAITDINIGGATIETGSTATLNIKNGTAPTALVADQIQIYSADTSDNTATLSLWLEQAVEDIGTFTASHKIKVLVNGTAYWMQLDAVA